MAAEVTRRFARFFIKVAFVFEPLTPRLISYYLGQTFKKWKQQNLIDKYKTKTRRLGKFHYKTEITFDLTSNQSAQIIDKWTNRKKIRR